MLLVQFMMAMQAGSYTPMIEVGTRMGSGHVQILHDKYFDEPRIEYLVPDVEERLVELRQLVPFEQVTVRGEAFVLISSDSGSSAGLVVGAIPDQERLISDLPSKVVRGTYLEQTDHAVIGAALGRNLQVDLGDELVLLGVTPEGSVAAAVLTVGGVFESTTALERSVIHIPLANFQQTFETPNQAHRFVAMVPDAQELDDALSTLRTAVRPNERIMDWRELMPEISQGIELDLISNAILQAVLLLVIVLSIVNTFVMIMYERTREYGMLFAIGMQRGAVLKMSLTEALMLWVVGSVCGGLLTAMVIYPLTFSGIPLPMDEATVEQQMAFMPSEIYPGLNAWVLFMAPAFIGIGSLLAVLLTSVRLFRLNIIESLRTE